MTEATDTFVGRARELGVMLGSLHSAVVGQGSVVLVAGEPGVGKTRLVEEVAKRHDGAVVWATCSHGATAPAFWPWLQVLRACTGEATMAALGGIDVRPLPETWPQSDAASDRSRFRLFEGVTSILAAAARESPLVVVLDDLQWADEASIRLLQFIGGEVRRLPLLVVGTYRDTDLEPSHPLGEAVADLARSGPHLTIGGLGQDELVALVRSIVGPSDDIDEQLGAVLHVQTGGNPFFARELARLLDADGRLASGQLRGRELVPGGVRAVVGRRLARLPQATYDLLSWAALVGTTFDVALLAAAADCDPRDVLVGLDPAIVARVVAPVDVGRFGFVHDLVREALEYSSGAAERAARHRALGAALAATAGDDVERIASVAGHLVAGAVGGDVDEAVRWAVRAAERAGAVLAYEDAAAWYDRALNTKRMLAAGDAEEISLLLALGSARLDAGRLPAARDAFVAAAELARARGDSEQLAAAALGLGAGLGGFEISLFDQVQIDLLEEALGALPAEDTSLRAWVLARLSMALAFVGNSNRRSELADEAISTARRVGDDVALAHALAGWCDVFSGPDDVDRRLAAAQEVIALATASGQRPLELLGRRLRIVALMERGKLIDADLEVDAFERVADVLRQPFYRWYVPLWRSTLAMTGGRFEDAARWTDEAERLGELAHSENAEILVAVQRFVRLRHEGHFPDAAEVVTRLLADVPDIGAPGSLEWSLLVRNVICGETDVAHRRADRLASEGLRAPRADSEWLVNLAQLADASVALQHHGLATAVYNAMEPYAELFVVEGIGAAVCGVAAHYLALTAGVLGRDGEAARFASLAEELHRAAGVFVPPPPLRPAAEIALEASPDVAAFRMEGGIWALVYGGTTVRLRDSKGLRDLAVLLRSPGTAVHVMELTGAPVAATAADLDATAIAAYRRRLLDIEEDLADADADHDTYRSENLRIEQEFLIAELTGAIGLGGRVRRSGDPTERARKAVTARIRDSIARITKVHPRLGRHLANAVRTGTWCSYEPEQPVRWES